MAAQCQRIHIEDVDPCLLGDEMDEPRRIEIPGLAHHPGLRETRDLRRQRRHVVERVGDHDDHGVRRVADDLLGDLLDDLGVDLEQVHAAHPRLAGQPGGDHDDVAAGGVGVVVGPDDLGAIPLDGPRLVHVERQALGQPLDDVGHHDLVGDVGLGEPLDGGRAVLAGADDGDLAHLSSGCVLLPRLVRIEAAASGPFDPKSRGCSGQ